MIAKRADALPFWEEARAKLGAYGPNSVVFYQKTPDDAGYAYRANNPYTETYLPPDENTDNWYIDKTYAAPWKENGKYEQGSRVYYFNGSRAYVYKPTIRYFGGTQPPNEEVDDDGIRTWEIEIEYKYGNTPVWFYESVRPKTEILIPVRKFGGYNGSKVSSLNPLGTEERFFEAYYEDFSGQQFPIYSNVLYYLEKNGIQSKDFSEINSKYQSFPYDDNTYVFYEQKLDSNNKPIHRKKGIHRAKFLKELNPNEVYFKYAESQYVHTYYGYYFDSYMRAHGFAIEMWPSVTDSEYELVTTSGFSQRGGYLSSGPYTPLSPLPFPSVSIDWKGEPYVTGTGFSGDMRDPNDEGFDGDYGENFDYVFKYDARFYRTSVAFNNRNGSVHLLKTDTFLGFDPYPIYDRQFINGQYVDVFVGIGYNGKYSEPVYSIVSEIVDSKEASYEEPPPRNNMSYTRSENLGNRIDLSKYQRALTTTSIEYCGWSVD